MWDKISEYKQVGCKGQVLESSWRQKEILAGKAEVCSFWSWKVVREVREKVTRVKEEMVDMF